MSVFMGEPISHLAGGLFTEILSTSIMVATANRWADTGVAVPHHDAEDLWLVEAGLASGSQAFSGGLVRPAFAGLSPGTPGGNAGKSSVQVAVAWSGQARVLMLGRTAGGNLLVSANNARVDPAPLRIFKVA